MTWVEVVVVEVDVVAVLVAEVDAGRAGWVTLRLPGRAVTASVPVVGIDCRTLPDSLATRRSALSVLRR